MATPGGRVTCKQCSANNFDTVSACWKCGASLSQGHYVPSPSPTGPLGTQPLGTQPLSGAMPTSSYGRNEQSAYSAGVTATAAASSFVQSLGDSAAANRAAFWLGMLMPYFGLPIGFAFIMMDDKRKQEVGRLCIMWSLISGVLHFLFMVVSMLGMRTYFQAALGAAISASKAGRGGGMGGGMDGL